ncbi:hypothetical protein E4U60_000176, partial [Claviceps pazoutovae]
DLDEEVDLMLSSPLSRVGTRFVPPSEILSSGVDAEATEQILDKNLGLLTPERTPFEESDDFQASRSLPDHSGSTSSSSVVGRIVGVSEGPGSPTQAPCDIAKVGDVGNDHTSSIDGLVVRASGKITPPSLLATAGPRVDQLSSLEVRGVSGEQDETALAIDMSVPDSTPISTIVLDSESSSSQTQAFVRKTARIQKEREEGQVWD